MIMVVRREAGIGWPEVVIGGHNHIGGNDVLIVCVSYWLFDRFDLFRTYSSRAANKKL